MELYAAKKTKERVYDFYIGGEVGREVNGTYIEGDMMFLNKNNMADRINFHINSEGGSVINGIRIISSIFNSKIAVFTYNNGFAMSMAGFIWLSAKKENRYMVQFGSLMIHAPRFTDGDGNMIEPENDDDKRMLDIMTAQLSSITEHGTGKSKEQVAKLLAKDSFYDVNECVKEGFLSKKNVITFDKMPQLTGSIQEKIQRIAAFYNDQNNNQKNSTMKEVAAKLKLNPEASSQAINEKIDSIITEKNEALAEVKNLQDTNNKNVAAVQDAEKKIQGLEAKVSEFEKKELEAKKALAVSEVKAAIEKGMFKKESKDDLEKIAIDNIEAFRTMQKSVVQTVQAPDITAHLEGAGNEIQSLAAEHGIKVEDFNYEYLWANNPDILKAIETEKPKVFKALESQFIKNNS